MYNANSPSEINHDILFREGVTSKASYTSFMYSSNLRLMVQVKV